MQCCKKSQHPTPDYKDRVKRTTHVPEFKIHNLYSNPDYS